MHSKNTMALKLNFRRFVILSGKVVKTLLGRTTNVKNDCPKK